jgi:CRP-like cAMP-binding protein
MIKAVQPPPLFPDPQSLPMGDEVIFNDNGQLNDSILAYADKIRCSAGHEIELQDCRAFYYVQQGIIEVSYTADETKITVALLGPGNFFGEIGFFDGGSRVRDIRATQDAEICRFDLAVIEKLYHEKPELYGPLVTSLTQLICKKFRRVLEENEPLIGYAASLATRRRGFTESRPMPSRLLKSPAWYKVNSEVEALKAELFNISYQLQKDTSSEEPDGETSKDCFVVLDTINENLAKYKMLMESQEDQDLMWGFIFKEIFPYNMRHRFCRKGLLQTKRLRRRFPDDGAHLPGQAGGRRQAGQDRRRLVPAAARGQGNKGTTQSAVCPARFPEQVFSAQRVPHQNHEPGLRSQSRTV